MKYAGIGSRSTPPDVLALMEVVARNLGDSGWTLRTGGAPGADTAFFEGSQDSSNAHLTEIYLPWDGFEGYHYQQLFHRFYVQTTPSTTALEIAQKYHPAWYRLGRGAKLLMGRNSHQVLGMNLDDPVNCVICWTEGGKLKGGTAQALRIANDHNIPVYNLGDELTHSLFADIIDS